MRTMVRLPPDLLARAKEKARREGTTLTALIQQGLRMVMAEPYSKRRQVKLPPVSRARGCLRPGVDPTKTSVLLDIGNEGLPLEKQR
jgi:hypothetical protein